MSGAVMRVAGPEDVGMMLDWAAAEGWNPGLEDAAAFLAADPDGFFVAEVAGVPAACIAVVNHSDDHAFLGLYICREDFRGQGIGYALWQYALTHAGGRNVGLDGVAAQEANYARSGFVRTGATLRFEGPAPEPGPGVRAMEAGDMGAIAALDRLACGMARPAFLDAWVAPARTRRTFVLEGGREIEGFATVRLCREGCKVGPVVAADPGSALALAGAAAAEMGQGRVILDVPEARTGMILALESAGFGMGFFTARMVRGDPPEAHPSLFAVASMELG